MTDRPIVLYDAILSLQTELKCGWHTDTGGNTVKAELVWEEKAVGIGNVKNERIFITPIRENITPFALHGDTYWHEIIMKVDIRTWTTLTRHNIVVKEIGRIIKNIIRNADDLFTDVIIMGNETLTPDYRNMFRHVITLKYRSAENHSFT